MNPASKAPNNVPYVVAVFVMLFLGFLLSFIVVLFGPSQDRTALIVAVFGFLTPTTLSLLTFMKSQETHLSVNSRLDGFIKNAEEAARAKGNVEGREQEKNGDMGK